jgi:hypothetical protein
LELTQNQANDQAIKDQEKESKPRNLRQQENSFRANLTTMVGAASLFVATLLVSLLVPIFPASVAIVLAIMVGALAFKVRPIAVMIMLAVAVFGYVYQLGLPITFIITISVILFFTSISALQSGSVLGIAFGVIAAALLVTPVYFLGILLILAVPLFRARGRNVGSMAGIIVFVLLAVPLLVNKYNGTGSPFLFSQVSLSVKAPLNFVNFNTIMARLTEAIPVSSQAVTQYMDKLNYFLPVFKPGDLFGGLLGVLLGGFIVAGIASAFGTMALLRWFERREAGGKILPLIAPTIAILLGALVTFLLLLAMNQPFMYQVSFDTFTISGIIASIAVLGGFGGLVEYWLRQRDLKIKLQEELSKLVNTTNTIIFDVSSNIQQAKVVCIRIDIGHEELLVHNIREELSIVSQGAHHLSIDVLQEKVDLFKNREEQLSTTSAETITKIRRYCEDSRQKYKEYIAGYSDLGYSFTSKKNWIPMADFSAVGLNNLIESQIVLNDLYKKTAQDAMKSVEETQKIINQELESEAGKTGIEIAHNYLIQATYGEVVDTLLTESINLNHIVTESTGLFESRVYSIVHECQRIIKTILIPAMDQVGDIAGVAYYSNLLETLNQEDWLQKAKGNLIEKTQWIVKTRDFAIVVVSVLADVSKRLTSLERAIILRAPAGFNWGSNSRAQADLTSFLNNPNSSISWDNLRIRVIQTEKALRVIENATPLIIEFARIYEFLINFVNLEYLMEEQLQRQGEIGERDIPVKLIYAQQYLRLFSETHPDRSYIEVGTGRLKKRIEIR